MDKSQKDKKRLQLGKLKLDTLLEVTKGINNNLSKLKLIEIYKNVLVNQLKIGKLLLFSFDGGVWNEELNIGTSKKYPINIKDDLIHLKEIEVLTQPLKNLEEFDVIVPVFHKSKPLAYLLLGDFAGERIEVSPIIKHLTFIQTLTNIIIVAIENKRLFKDNLNQIAIQKEMELASDMQRMLFPEVLPNNIHLEASAKYNPHHLVGGDYYDFIRLNEDEVAFCIADVSGKGVPAALIMSNFQASLRALIKRTSSLTELITELNYNIISNAKREKFITAFIGRYNCRTRNLRYVNSGHNPPLLLVGHQFQQLEEGSTILGMFNDLPTIIEKNITIPQNAVVVCFTDGVTEQVNIQNEEFGVEKLEKAMLLNKDKCINVIIDSVYKDLEEHKSTQEYHDDIALLGLRFK